MTKPDEIASFSQFSVVSHMFPMPKTLWLDLVVMLIMVVMVVMVVKDRTDRMDRTDRTERTDS